MGLVVHGFIQQRLATNPRYPTTPIEFESSTVFSEAFGSQPQNLFNTYTGMGENEPTTF